MKRVLSIGLGLGLLAASLAGPALAGRKKHNRLINTTLYARAAYPLGEVERLLWETPSMPCRTNAPFPVLVDAKPDGAIAKSHAIFTVATGSDQSIGPAPIRRNPIFEGSLKGTIRGDVRLVIHVAGTRYPSLEARLWTDPKWSGCAPAVEPEALTSFNVDLDGKAETEAVFEDVDLKARSSIVVEVRAPSLNNGHGVSRLLYDAADSLTRVIFSCAPPKGKKTCS